jgi:hypothetical protein
MTLSSFFADEICLIYSTMFQVDVCRMGYVLLVVDVLI